MSSFCVEILEQLHVSVSSSYNHTLYSPFRCREHIQISNTQLLENVRTEDINKFEKIVINYYSMKPLNKSFEFSKLYQYRLYVFLNCILIKSYN